MPRPTNKAMLLKFASDRFDKLWNQIELMPEKALSTEFEFKDLQKYKEAHWRRDKNLRDVLVHLYEWHRLLINWIQSNSAGNPSDFLPSPYNWKTYGDMNIEFWRKHQSTPLNDAKEMLKASHQEALALVEQYSDQELFTKQYFDWTGTTTLGSYCVSALSSHYDWAVKKLRLHVKNVK